MYRRVSDYHDGTKLAEIESRNEDEIYDFPKEFPADKPLEVADKLEHALLSVLMMAGSCLLRALLAGFCRHRDARA